MNEYKICVTFSNMDIALNNPNNCIFNRLYDIFDNNEKSAMLQLLNMVYDTKPENVSVDEIKIISII